MTLASTGLSISSRARALAQYAIVALGLALVLPAPLLADTVTVKGTALKGKVVGVTPDGIDFETDYGDGVLKIPYGDIEHLATDDNHYVLHGEDALTEGRLIGVVDDNLLVGDDPETAERISTGVILESYSEEKFETSRWSRLQSDFRYWNVNFDLAFALTQATIDTSAFSTVLELRREKDPTRIRFGASYRLSTTKDRSKNLLPGQGKKETLENEIRGWWRSEWDLAKRIYWYSEMSAEYDSVERLSIRLDPTVGAGYRIFEHDKGWLSGDVGFGYVYQRYFGGDTEKYPALALGLETDWDLPFDSHFNWWIRYLPSLEDFVNVYLLKTEASLTVPIIEILAFKFTVGDIYNSSPATNSRNNTFTTTAGLSFTF